MNRNFPWLALASALLLASTACGGRSSKPGAEAPSAAPQICRDSSPDEAAESEPAAMDAGDDYDSGDNSCWTPNEHDEITRLWNEIREERVSAGMTAEPLSSETSRVHPMSVQKIQEETEHRDPKTKVCISTHKLEHSICKNATSICRLAGELSDDEWATEKCDSGKASCGEATKKCVDCLAGESLPSNE